MKTIRVELPDRVHDQIEILVREGWFRSPADIVEQAVRRFLDTHRPELMEKHIREDVDRGLRGVK
jgi:Arc/MetJ-type ribon-helix-helix transcriptional regulator